jgi:TetR/AcrR family transcriptional regulator of autoinduction and epiphytic fitness
VAGRNVARGAITGDGSRPMPSSDRRLIRGERTREAIVEAEVELIDAGNPRPSVRQVAERAGISVSQIYYHFGSVEVLVVKAAAMQVSRHCLVVAVIPPRGPVDVRIRATCHQRRRVLETVAPVLRVAYSRGPGSPPLDDVLAEQRALLRRQVAATFGPELSSRGPQGGLLLEALDVATGWQTWDALRLHRGHSASAAEKFVVYWVTDLLG